METNQQRDERLWRIAKARAGFRTHLMTYPIVNAFLWAIWFLTNDHHQGVPWPVWPMCGWGLGLAFAYYNAYHRDPFGDATREYEKLQQEKQQRGL
ncbi:2TM domain-containing protein [Chitinophaga sp.]|uniref:2TM domain-containing protein n=1 Tax=Chitinophaga sp. TaxID=1869181 RepID=UPI0031E36819